MPRRVATPSASRRPTGRLPPLPTMVSRSISEGSTSDRSGLARAPQALGADPALAAGDVELAPPILAFAERTRNPGLGPPAQGRSGRGLRAHVGQAVPDHDRTARRIEQSGDDPSTVAGGILHQAPTLVDAHDLHRQALPVLDPGDRVGLARPPDRESVVE